MSKWSMSNRQTDTKAAISPIKTNKTRPFIAEGRVLFCNRNFKEESNG